MCYATQVVAGNRHKGHRQAIQPVVVELDEMALVVSTVVPDTFVAAFSLPSPVAVEPNAVIVELPIVCPDTLVPPDVSPNPVVDASLAF